MFFFRPVGQVVTMFRARLERRAQGKGERKSAVRKSLEDGEGRSTRKKA